MPVLVSADLIRRRPCQVRRALWTLIAVVMITAGCASASTGTASIGTASIGTASTGTGDGETPVAAATPTREDAAEAGGEDRESDTSGITEPALDADEQTAGPDSSPDASDDATTLPGASGDDPATSAATVAADPASDEAPSTIEPTSEPADAFADTELPPAPIGFEALAPESGGRQPVSMVIEDIDVVDATIIPVGVNPDQTFEVPPADQVGWYRFGPTPGEEGSAVLAAHIAFDGVDGVFRHLADVEVGAVVVVGYDDGTSQRYRINSVTDYFKEELPAELFARDGDTQLALITCGGTFNPQLRSYESNTVAVATPI